MDWLLAAAILVSAEACKYGRLRRQDILVPFKKPRLIHIEVARKQLAFTGRGFAVTMDDLAQLTFAELQVFGYLILPDAKPKYVQLQIRVHFRFPEPG
jgi:hypothetical protein